MKLIFDWSLPKENPMLETLLDKESKFIVKSLLKLKKAKKLKLQRLNKQLSEDPHKKN